MRNYKGIASLVILSVLILLGTFFAFRQEAQDKFGGEKDEATVIQEGVMNDRQRKNSKLYNLGEKARSLIKKTQKDLRIVTGEPYPIEASGDTGLPSQNAFIQELDCKSEAVLVGRVKSKVSQLSEDGKSVFTDYEVEVKDLIKDTKPERIKNGQTITVTRSGGAVKLHGRIIEVFNKSYKLLNVDREYLLFLGYLNDSDSYKPTDIEGTFEIYEGRVRRFTDTYNKYQPTDNALQDFITEIRTTLPNCF
jgi:hypothetical protein